MSLTWKYKIDLQDTNIWEKYEKVIGSQIPKKLQHFIEKYNAASPSENNIMINGKDRIFDSVLSFNEKEADAMTFSVANRSLEQKGVIPFGIDPFGNLFCYIIDSNTISIYNHEEQTMEDTTYDLESFIKNLK